MHRRSAAGGSAEGQGDQAPGLKAESDSESGRSDEQAKLGRSPEVAPKAKLT